MKPLFPPLCPDRSVGEAGVRDEIDAEIAAQNRRGLRLAYLVMAFGVGITLLFRWQLSHILGERGLYSTLLPTVILAAHLGGFWPGVVATIAGAAAMNYLLVNHLLDLELKNAGDSVALLIFVVTGFVISLLSESLRRAHQRILADERRRAEMTLRRTEERFVHLVQNSSDIISIFSPEGTILYQTPSVRAVLDEDPEARMGRNVFEDSLVHPDDLAAKRAFFRMMQKSDSPVVAEFRLRHADGSWRDIEAIGQNLLKEPSVGGLIANYRDVTERKRADRAIRESEQRWRILVQMLPQLIWTTSPAGRPEFFSPQVSNFTGLPETELLRDGWNESIPSDERPQIIRRQQQATAARAGYDLEHRLRRADGIYRWFKVRAVPIRDSDGAITKWLGSATDITDDKEVEHALRTAKEAAESANRAKDEFLANVSHEIRTPMNAILGMTELVLEAPLADSQRNLLRTVKSAADNLLSIINDLLDFSKIEAGKLHLELVPFSLRGAVGDVVRMLSLRAHAQGLEMLCEIEHDVPEELVGDEGRLRQVLVNLIGNAIKFTPSGEVIVTVRVERRSDRDAVLSFAVRDTGIGIPLEKQQAVFRAFEQQDSSTTRKYGGTGLGLTIASHLVTAMGGTISLESEPGRGSEFHFTARFELAPAGSEGLGPGTNPQDLEGRRVLVVDDNETNRVILEGWLRRWRVEPTLVVDGPSALAALASAAEQGQPYDLALLDRWMPDMDGIELARQIRSADHVAKLPMILLTSGDATGDDEQIRSLKINASLHKPCPQRSLFDTMRSLLSTGFPVPHAAAGANGATSLAPPPSRPLRVLVAEDNDFNLLLLEQLLRQRRHIVTLAKNGRAALDLARSDEFDILLLDLHMPELDGFQVIRGLREHEAAMPGRHLPTIALTARSTPQIREQCLAAGMDDLVPKPMKADQLWETIDRLVGPAVATEPPAPEHSSPDQPPAELPIDRDMIHSVCGGDAEILRKLAESFSAHLPGQMREIEADLSREDLPALREGAHKIASTLRAFSQTAGETAVRLEEAAELGQLEECRRLTGRLSGCCRVLIPQVANLRLDDLWPAEAPTS